jgi:2-polyprenyl-3-methyl-5-hydroxy-6-metoxy-1,4-benzoquinol methylase
MSIDKEIINKKSPLEYQEPCIICGSLIKYQKFFKDYEKDGRFYSVYICPKCRLGITQPFPDKDQLEKLYSRESYREGEKRFILPVEKFIRFSRRLRRDRIERIIRKGRILDIGCARGVFLSGMLENGWDTFGLELDEETASYAKNILGLNIKTGELADANFENDFFDVITIWHVLEHLPDPFLTITECKRILKPEGLLVIAIPNFDSLQAKIFGKHWFHLDVPYHLYHFNMKNLRLLLEKNSFKIIKMKHFSLEFNPFGYLQSFLNMLQGDRNFLYNTLKSKSIRKSLLSNMHSLPFYFKLCTTILLAPVFIPLSLVLSLIESILRQGGTVELYALKQNH